MITQAQRIKAFLWISIFHIFIIFFSNYLVQLPISIGNFYTNWGTFSFPFIFLATDLTVLIFGLKMTRRIIFMVMTIALFISYISSLLFSVDYWQDSSVVQARNLNICVGRIALASFIAYTIGQITDIYLFSRLYDKYHRGIVFTISTLFSNIIDTTVFFSLLFGIAQIFLYRSTY